MDEDKTDFVAKEHEEQFVISQAELQDACVDIDLDQSPSPSEFFTTTSTSNTAASHTLGDYDPTYSSVSTPSTHAIEPQQRTKPSAAGPHPAHPHDGDYDDHEDHNPPQHDDEESIYSDPHYYADVEDADDDISYSIAIDDEIVKDVLAGSDERQKKRRILQGIYCKAHYATFLLCCMCVGLYYLIDLFPDALIYKDIEAHGSAFHYEDEDAFLEKPKPGENLFDIPVEPSGEGGVVVVSPQVYDYVVGVRGPAFRKNVEMPFFVQHNDGSTIVEELLSKCLEITIAGASHPVPNMLQDSLTTFDIEGNRHVQTYATVDLSTKSGIMNAKEKNLIPQSKDVGVSAVFTPHFYFAAKHLFSPQHKARLFTVIRNPVDRTIAEYYTFTKNQKRTSSGGGSAGSKSRSASDENLAKMTLEEFMESKYYRKNWFTTFVSGDFEQTLTDRHLDLAKELLRTKFVIGLHDNLYGAIALFQDYFFMMGGNNTKAFKKCKKVTMKGEYIRNFAIYHKIGHRIKQNSTDYNSIVERNKLDMELYWYGAELHSSQRSWIPKLG